jgi:general secretion pathway protein K
MAILYVLWGLGLLAMIAVSFLGTGNISYALSHTGLETARHQAAVEASVARAVLALTDPRPDRRWRVDGVPQEFAWEDTPMRVAIQDELGLIDLNQADQGLLTGLFRAAGLNATDAAGLTDRVLDWRDPNPARRLNGAKEREYRAAGLSYGPRDGPFQSVDELQLVMGMTKEFYARVKPAITVYSGRPFIDPKFAPQQTLLALPAMNAQAAAVAIAARNSSGPRNGILDPGIPLGGRAFTVRTELATDRGVYVHETVIRLTDRPDEPYWVLSWKSK